MSVALRALRPGRPAVRGLSSSAAVNPAAAAAFRRLMRARADLFQGDAYALDESRSKLREEFGAQREVSDPEQIAELLRGADEVEELLRENVVQGRLNERGNYAVKVKGAAEDLNSVAEPISDLEISLAEAELSDATHKP